MKNRLDNIKENEEGFGTITYSGVEQIGKPGINSLNFQINFENLLKLRLALDAAALELNKYNKNQLRSKGIGVNLFFGKHERITVTIY